MPKIDFIFDNIPDKAYKKDENSNLYKILSSIASELDVFVNDMDRVRNAKFVDFAAGKDLDKLGALLNLKRFSNESDLQYRGRIKSRVPSFVGGGTVSSIKQVISNLLGVEPVIIEHYRPGEGHAYFHNGVLKGLIIKDLGENQIEIDEGVSYINGTRITSNQSNHILESHSIDRIDYIFLDNNADIVIQDNNTYDSNTLIPIAEIDVKEDGITIRDVRFILKPDEHYITNIATITIQVPYQFNEERISFAETKNIIKTTKAAGIAVLMRIVGVYEDIISVKDDKPKFYFLMNLSGMSSDSFLGG